MMTEDELVATVGRIEVTVLRHWVELGWIVPEPDVSPMEFDEQDAARAHLICDLVYDFAMADDSVPVVLSLIDQLHDARRLVRTMAAAIESQPEDVRQQIAAALKSRIET